MLVLDSMSRKLDVKPIQDFYSNGASLEECAAEFGFADVKWAMRHGLKRRSRSENGTLVALRKRKPLLVLQCGYFKCSKSYTAKKYRDFCCVRCAAKASSNPRKISAALLGKPSSQIGVLKSFSHFTAAAKRAARALYFGKDTTAKRAVDLRKIRSEAGKLAAITRKLNGTQNTFPSRLKLMPSYPEKVFMNWATNRGVSFTRELKQGRYFIDFAITGNIAIEIDGKQHQWPDRKAHDAKKDAFLTSVGWRVIRVKWSSARTAPWASFDSLVLSHVINRHAQILPR